MTHRDRPCGPSGRREAAGDAVHRQGFPTPPGAAGAPPAIQKRGHALGPGRSAWTTGAAAFKGFRTTSPTPCDAPHRHAQREWPKALESRPYGSLL